jgi:hypothetical protein
MFVTTFLRLCYGDKLEHDPRLSSIIISLFLSLSLCLSHSATSFLNLFTTELVATLYHKVPVGYGVQQVCNSPSISPACVVTLQLDFVLSYRFNLSSSQSSSCWHCTARFNYTAVYLINLVCNSDIGRKVQNDEVGCLSYPHASSG